MVPLPALLLAHEVIHGQPDLFIFVCARVEGGAGFVVLIQTGFCGAVAATLALFLVPE